MPSFDERLKERLSRVTPEVAPDPIALFHDVTRRRSRRATYRKAGRTALVVIVLCATALGFGVLERAFRQNAPTVLSPTGQINGPFVVSVPYDHTNERPSHLEAVPLDGSAARLLTDPREQMDLDSPSVTRDGRYAAYLQRGGDATDEDVILVLDLVNGQTRTVHTGLWGVSGPAWSPDGTSFALTGSRLAKDADATQRSLDLGGPFGVWILPTDGSGTPRLVTESIGGHQVWGGRPDWSSDGAMLAFEVGDSSDGGSPHIVSYELATGESHMLAYTDGDVAGEPAWSPDGTRIAYTVGGGVWTMTPSGQDRELVAGSEGVRPGDGMYPHGVSWSPDGKWLAYLDDGPEKDTQGVYTVGLDGSSPTFVVAAESFAWLAQNDLATWTFETAPTPSAEPEGQDLGLEQRVCVFSRLKGMDLLGAGALGSAWTGAFLREDGTCPSDPFSKSFVVVDFDGDERADSYSSLQYCVFCSPFAAVDLTADGRDELVVVAQHSSTPQFVVFGTDRREGRWGLYPVRIGGAGHPEAFLAPGDVLSFSTGGDEGFSGWVACEGFPSDPVLVVTWSDYVVEVDDTKQVHVTRLRLTGTTAEVISATDFSLPVSAPVPGVSDEPACGEQFQTI